MQINNLKHLLKQIVSIPSDYPNEMELSLFLYRYFVKRGFKVFKQVVDKNRINILVEKGSGKESILLYSHMDTIPVTKGWNSNPYILTIHNDKAYGLGTWDMKAGMVANIFAFIDSQTKNMKVKLAFCVDEENISKGGHALIKSQFIEDVTCVISTEPAFQNGLRGIVTGRVGRAPYQLNISCQPKHFAFYQEQYDPCLFTFYLIEQLTKLNQTQHEKKQFVFVRSISTKTHGLSTPQNIMLELDTSVVAPLTHKRMLTNIKHICSNASKKFHHYFQTNVDYVKRETPFLEGYEIKQNNKHLSLLKKSVLTILKQKAIPYFRSSVADENIFGNAGITTLSIGPEGGNAHAPNEWVSLSSINSLYNILHTFIQLKDH